MKYRSFRDLYFLWIHFYFMNYQKIYNDLCIKGKVELEKRVLNKKLWTKTQGINGEYYEGHHIIPKCFNGTGKSNQWYHQNITPLTPKEHYIAHLLLCKIYPNDKRMFYALHRMIFSKSKNHNRYIPSSRTYEWLRKEHSIKISGDGNGMFGKGHSEKSKNKMKKPKSEKHKQNLKRPKVFNTLNGLSPHSKPVLQFDLNHNKIGEYQSITIAEQTTGANNIISACKGHLKTSGGYIWKYKVT